jgi:autophagy-related protein 9
MTSNFFSRLAPASQQRSFYEELRSRNDDLDVEDRAGFALDDENLNHSFQEDEIDPETLAIEHSRMTQASDPRPDRRRNTRPSLQEHDTTWSHPDEEGDNDVPASLLVENNAADPPLGSTRPARTTTRPRAHGAPEPSTRRLRAQWETTQHQQRLHRDDNPAAALPHTRARSNRVVGSVVTGTDEQKAMWRWVNITNLDSFMQDVYDYYRGNGLWCILLDRVLHLVEVGFIVAFLTFLTQCIDYSKFPHSKSMGQVLVPQCTKKMSGLWNFGLWIFVFYFIWKAIQIPLDIRRLLHLRDFYSHLLGIPEHDMQTVSWQDVVVRIMALRDQNPKTAGHLTARQRKWLGSQSKERLDAHDIANRLMRRENFLIALINKDILDLTIPLPFLKGRQYLSRLLEWTLNFSIMDYVFDERGQVNQEFLKSDRRGQLSQKLRARFLFAGVMTLMIAPVMAGYLFVMHFLTYFHVSLDAPARHGVIWFDQPTDFSCRNTARTPRPWAREHTRPWPSGSSESSTSFLTSSKNA